MSNKRFGWEWGQMLFGFQVSELGLSLFVGPLWIELWRRAS